MSQKILERSEVMVYRLKRNPLPPFGILCFRMRGMLTICAAMRRGFINAANLRWAFEQLDRRVAVHGTNALSNSWPWFALYPELVGHNIQQGIEYVEQLSRP